MTWSEKISLHLAKQIKTEDSPYSIGQLAHGIEIFLLNIINGIALLVVSALLHIVLEVALVSFLFFLYRIITGGVHLRNPWRCSFATLLLMNTGGFTLKHLPAIPSPYIYLLILVTLGLAFTINYRYAPAKHTYAPDHPEVQKKTRIIALFLIGGSCVLSLILVEYAYILILANIIAVLTQSALLLPGSFLLVSRLENFLERVVEK
ncbi:MULTISPECIES: accessory gene regulator B family protein [Brevibacillus]|uniref:Accessory regulator AgrB n=1 Tax=Brevibacillus invocatus TaxID=173959 RepID=A0A3M8CNL3_9BACL|nr:MULTISPECIES: accessory gene regulator B family protein [Brevibacillus]MCM3079713.1 accessory gene regulator B family protein [Brevibacillus invocatus]MCM3431486.1 accessory gene regulator B family protein [Brevibacillus invocatus]MDH4618314.1 accessory gene regulator B family protein [Brevibacillus sp. AY1]RNB77041.1 accessory regulator AgrB [Brevibacillus invocatus]